MQPRTLSPVVAIVIVAASFTAGASALDEEVQFSGTVTVAADGNGWMAARFPTTLDGNDVTYYLDVWTGCAGKPELERDGSCPPAVKALAVTLNGEIVFQTASAFRTGRAEVLLHLVGTADNEIMVSADGDLHSTAGFAIFAIRQPPRQP